MEHIANYIDGKLVPPTGGEYLENIEPATGLCYSMVPDSLAVDVDAAVEAAERAFPLWASIPVDDQAKILREIADRITDNLEELAPSGID